MTAHKRYTNKQKTKFSWGYWVTVPSNEFDAHGNAKRKQVTKFGYPTKKDALKAESIVKSELMRGKFKLVDNTENTTLKQAINLYLEYSKANKRSHKLDDNYCKIFSEFFGNNTRLKDITPQKIERFKTFLKDGRKNATVNRYTEALGKMFNVAIANNIAKIMLQNDKNYKGGTNLILKQGMQDLYSPKEALTFCLFSTDVNI